MLKIVLFFLFAFVAVIIARTLMFTPNDSKKNERVDVEFDKEETIKTLGELVKCKTVSYYDHSLEDDNEFEKLVNKLPELYPNVTKTLELKRFDGRALLFHWKGKNNNDPAVFMAHYDVVPVVEEDWTHPAFDALIENNIMWGRGTLDTKITFNGIMSAGENLLKQGFVPENDIYFAFSGGEEVSGPGANEIVKYFQESNITPSFVIDEGGAVVEDIFPGVKEPCGLIGIAEKGLMNLEFFVKSNGGHASAPSPHTPVGVLSMACAKVEAHPFKRHFTAPVLKMFDELGRRSSFLYRMIFANLWCFGGILDMICKKSGGELNALVRTTCAFTQMEGSDAPNVVPPQAKMVANLRLNPEDSVDSAVAYIKKVINNEDIELKVLEGADPSRISIVDCDGYKWIKEAIEDTWTGSIVSPYLMVQCSDSRNYGVISDRVYRFSAMDLTSEERKTIHGNDEHVRLETVKRATEFFIRVMKNC